MFSVVWCQFQYCLHRLYVMIRLVTVQFSLLSGHLLVKSCSLGSPYFLFVLGLFVFTIIYLFCFDDRIQLVMTVHTCSLSLFTIMQTGSCNVYPLTPHFYIAELGFTGVFIFFLFLLLNIDCGYLLEPPK